MQGRGYLMIERIKHYGSKIKEGYLRELIIHTIWIYQYAKHYWKAMVFYTLLGMSGTVIALLSSMVSRDLVDIITGHQTGRLLMTFSMMIGMSLASTIISQLTGYVSYKISMKVDAEIKSDIFSKMLVTDWESITNYHTGDLLNRWTGDASTISNGILNWIPNLVVNLFRFFSAFAVVAYNDITFAFFSFIGIPVSILMSRTLMTRMAGNNKKSAEMSAKMYGFNQEAFSNIQNIKAFHAISYYIKRLKALQGEYISMQLSFQRMSIITSLIMTVVGLIVSYSAYGWGIYRVWSGAISYGTMTMFLSLSGTLSSTLNQLISMVPSAISLSTSAGRLMDILEMPREDYSDDDFYEAEKDNFMQYGTSITVNNIRYAYHGGEDVFTDASFEAHPHETIALVGPSGEGKTTMLRILLSLLRPQDGSVKISYTDNSGQAFAHSLSASSRKLISYVSQGNTMVSGTIAENLRIAKPDATEDEIVEALKLACAWDFIEKLPNGIYSEVKERGGGFSEGQAQRLSIARALLKKSPVLLLDEATSALDVETERRVLKNIMADDSARTCIVTTHRPTVLNMCQRVYTIRDRKCVVLEEEEIEKMVREF